MQELFWLANPLKKRLSPGFVITPCLKAQNISEGSPSVMGMESGRSTILSQGPLLKEAAAYQNKRPLLFSMRPEPGEQTS